MSDRIGSSGVKLIIINFVQVTIFRFAYVRELFRHVYLRTVSYATGMTRAACHALIVCSKYGLCGRVYEPCEHCGRRTRV